MEVSRVNRFCDLHTMGNTHLLELEKVAFLCSRRCPEAIFRRARQWADDQRESGTCVISGVQSPVELDVYRRLATGSQPMIVALARGLKRESEPEFSAPLAQGRLLLITRYAETVTHPDEEKCLQRNRLMMTLADRIVVGYAAPGGKLERLCGEFSGARLEFL